MPALVGKGVRAKPGEILWAHHGAHHGVLFLDALPEFSARALDSLRQPLETGEVVVTRANPHIAQPTRFPLVAAMNPCRRDGGPGAMACSCRPRYAQSYQVRLSRPLLDHIDLQRDVPAIPAAHLALPE
jgi:magnesium chelatase family protein